MDASAPISAQVPPAGQGTVIENTDGYGERAAERPAIPLFHAAWIFALGIAATQFVYLRPSWLLLALAPIALLGAIAAFRTQRVAWLPLSAMGLLLGIWCAEMEPHPAPAPQLAAASDGLMRTIEGTVVDLTVDRGPALAADALRRLDNAGITLVGLALREPSLDDVFLNLTCHKAEDVSGLDADVVTSGRRAKKAHT